MEKFTKKRSLKMTGKEIKKATCEKIAKEKI